MKPYLPSWSVVSITGPDAVGFVQNLCTNDIKPLSEGHACEAFFTDVKAHIVAHTIVCRTADGCRVVVTSSRATELAEHLDRYHIRENLMLTVAEDINPVLLFGEPTQGFEVAGLEATLVFDSASQHWANAMSGDEFQSHRLEHGFPLDSVDVDNRRLPQEVGRDALAISFTKGCYLGQETVARIDALGHVNRLLVTLRLEGDNSLSPGDALTVGDKPVGEVTSVGWSPAHHAPLVMAYVRREHASPGTTVDTPAGPAVVLPSSN